MKTRTLIAAAVAALAFGGFAKDIYLLVGQSNMAGRASLRGGDVPCDGPHPELGMIHFNTRSVRTLGQRYAAAYLRLVK